MNFDDFFKAARNSSPPPFDYQCRLACGDQSPNQERGDWLAQGAVCESKLINVPTGLGKTAAVVLAWLWNRLHPAFNHPWPRRLVYCLPMRTLVEQTQNEITKWLDHLRANVGEPGFDREGKEELAWLRQHSPVVLMGGEETDRDWDIHPEKPAILVGTQDMLLSRALNRGYGMSRYRWPIHFGLLNNDCLWVMDETQLMGVGVETSVQLAGFRGHMGTLAPCHHWWMSATLEAERFATPEAPPQPERFHLTEQEPSVPAVQQRVLAVKRLHRARTNVTDDATAYATALADEVVSAHVSGTLTLVIINTVERAQEVFREMRQRVIGTPVTLLHSRFRPAERQKFVQQVLQSAGDHIVVSTQVVEAGVDLSSRTLFTELAPWSSLVQRFGRCHRHGEFADGGADVHWVNVPDTAARPYEADGLGAARHLLANLSDASLAALNRVNSPVLEPPPRHSIRPKDLRELFDTTPDIAGADLDISRFIREGDDTDCAVFWRDAAAAADATSPAREELCAVPVTRLREFADKHRDSKVWTWDALARTWVHPDRFIPGRTYWLHASLGGYDLEIGFDRRSKKAVQPVPGASEQEEAHDDERGTSSGCAESLETHTAAVLANAGSLFAALDLPASLSDALRRAAAWHDAGKAHPAFQLALRKANPALATDRLWAKSGSKARLDFGERPHFRHELASALAFRALASATTADSALVAYLIAAHHGKVRLSLRALPGENEPPPRPDATDPLFARGVWEGDMLPPLVLDGRGWPATSLSLAPMQIGLGPDGQPSWLEACLALRDAADLGPFRLALLETVLRAADARGSRETQTPAQPDGASGVASGMELREPSLPHPAAAGLTPTEQSLVAELVADGLRIQDKFRPEPLYKQTGKGHYASQTVEEIRRAKDRKGEPP
ncbi:MAG TPA: CRISPR-associated helicase Cas3' [Verrucomicrobiota bacterium]|nr:CRISPR-associated helicase Cas3' [Verrucomicrobiota bacterium]HNU51367.1 CRISPR-associated helicase Cas3' [Verrucomicrobiota bacterium]